jgi:hypothetical protein
MKAAKRASQIKGFMRFSFFKQALSTFAVPPHPDVHREVNATYTQNGAELTMRWQRAGMTKGRINGNEFTMNNEGMIFFYRK